MSNFVFSQIKCHDVGHYTDIENIAVSNISLQSLTFLIRKMQQNEINKWIKMETE